VQVLVRAAVTPLECRGRGRSSGRGDRRARCVAALHSVDCSKGCPTTSAWPPHGSIGTRERSGARGGRGASSGDVQSDFLIRRTFRCGNRIGAVHLQCFLERSGGRSVAPHGRMLANSRPVLPRSSRSTTRPAAAQWRCSWLAFSSSRSDSPRMLIANCGPGKWMIAPAQEPPNAKVQPRAAMRQTRRRTKVRLAARRLQRSVRQSD
jgi:hypothetical protein